MQIVFKSFRKFEVFENFPKFVSYFLNNLI